MEQGVVKRLATVFRSVNEHAEVLHHLLLAAEIVEVQRAQSLLKLFLGRAGAFPVYVKVFCHIAYKITKSCLKSQI